MPPCPEPTAFVANDSLSIKEDIRNRLLRKALEQREN